MPAFIGLAVLLILAALVLRFVTLALGAWIIVMNVTDILSNGWDFWPVFWILFAVALAITPTKFNFNKKD